MDHLKPSNAAVKKQPSDDLESSQLRKSKMDEMKMQIKLKIKATFEKKLSPAHEPRLNQGESISMDEI